MKRGTILLGGAMVAIAAVFALASAPNANAADTPRDFNLQVTPSPLVVTVKPGTKTEQELKVFNRGTGAQQLKIQTRSFSFDSKTGHVNLGETTPPGIASWISFSAPTFGLDPGQAFTEKITFNIPKEAGFSYSFALVIGPQTAPKPTGGTRAISGSVAIFSLINVDRPGAKSELKLVHLTSTKRMYQYLPATFDVRFSNTGNTIAQPFGNLFIQRGSDTKTHMAMLDVNPKQGYILPGTERSITATWNDGFPAYQTVNNPDGTTSQKLVWNWANLSKLRIGRYTAHLVAVYSDSGRDVPVEGEVSFWVLPWKILSVVLLIALLLLFALFMLVRAIVRPILRRVRKDKKTTPSASEKA